MSTISSLTSLPQAAASKSRKEAASSQAQDVVVLPANARSLEEARQEIDKARALMKELGGRVTRDLPATGAVKARLDGAAREKLQEAGFRVVEDTTVKAFPQRPTPKAPLAPGWLLNGLDAAQEASRAALEGKVDMSEPLTCSQPEGLSTAESPIRWDLDEQPGFRPFQPFIRRERTVQGEGPSDFVGQLPTTGKGVTIAVLDTGLYPHPDFEDRVLTLVSATGEARFHPDAMGHGTHVAADAAGSGKLSGGRFKGPAPDAHLVGIQVLNGEGEGSMSEVIENLTAGVNWMVENKEQYNIKVANLSLGLPLVEYQRSWFGPSTLYDPIGAAINRAVEAGITVVVAAGNDGSDPGTINASPAINDNVITVGALDTQNTRDRSDDRVADFSSRGPTPDGRVKPDILAPGVNIMAANSPGSIIEQQNEQIAMIRQEVESMSARQLQMMAYKLVRAGMAPPELLRVHPEDLRESMLEGMQTHATHGRNEGGAAYMAMDGTSMASPIVAGVCAAVLEANPNLSPDQVKTILMKTSDRLPGVRANDQGAGVLNAQKAVAVASQLAQRA